MQVKHLRMILSHLHDDEEVACLIITHAELHHEALKLGLDIDCEWINMALAELEEMVRRGQLLHPDSRAIALKRIMNLRQFAEDDEFINDGDEEMYEVHRVH